jgi:hypothetical protein
MHRDIEKGERERERERERKERERKRRRESATPYYTIRFQH